MLSVSKVSYIIIQMPHITKKISFESLHKEHEIAFIILQVTDALYSFFKIFNFFYLHCFFTVRLNIFEIGTHDHEWQSFVSC